MTVFQAQIQKLKSTNSICQIHNASGYGIANFVSGAMVAVATGLAFNVEQQS